MSRNSPLPAEPIVRTQPALQPSLSIQQALALASQHQSQGRLQGKPQGQAAIVFPEPCVIEPRASRDALQDSPHLKEKELTRLQEHAFLLSRC